MLGLPCRAPAFSSLVVVSRGYSLVVVSRLLIGVACLVEHRLSGAWGSVVAVSGLLRLPGSGVQALLLCGSGIFLDQGSNLCLLHWQADSLPLSHQGSPILLIFISTSFSFSSIIV